MAFVIADRVKETSTTTGTGALTLAGAMTGFQTFAAKCAVGDTAYYALQGVDGNGTPTGEWECGLGTYSSASTLTRTTVTSSSNADAVVTLSAGTKQVYITVPAIQAAWPRERLTAARAYYVATTGSDSSDGLTVGTAFLTIQKAVDICATLDPGLYQPTVQLGDGTYTTGAVVPPMRGALPLIIRGNNATPTNVHVSVSGTCFLVTQASAYLQVLDMKISASGVGIGLSAAPYGIIEYGNIVFGACDSRHVNAQYHGHTNAVSNYSIIAGGQRHVLVANGATSRLVGRTVTITGTPAFSVAFAAVSDNAAFAVSSNTWSGSATGVRYAASMNGTIASLGATLPGDSAGTTATGGQYT